MAANVVVWDFCALTFPGIFNIELTSLFIFYFRTQLSSHRLLCETFQSSVSVAYGGCFVVLLAKMTVEGNLCKGNVLLLPVTVKQLLIPLHSWK